MRVSDAAKIAGCSVRTVRYYHNLGLLPVPAKQRGPWRDYEFADVARLIQIRSMAQAGMRLDDIRLELSAAETAVMVAVPTPAAASTQLVDAPTATPAVADPADCDCEIYDQTLRSLDQQIAKLQQQRARLLEMKQQAMMKSPPLSKTVHDLYMEAEEILKSEQEFEALGFIQRKHKLAILFSELGFSKLPSITEPSRWIRSSWRRFRSVWCGFNGTIGPWPMWRTWWSMRWQWIRVCRRSRAWRTS